VAHVDHEDDTIWRWVIQHYRFNPKRRERRNVIVAAYDNETEFRAEFNRYVEMIRGEIAAAVEALKTTSVAPLWNLGISRPRHSGITSAVR